MTKESIPVSAVEHTAYCPRQAALIHNDRYFESNADTVRGDIAHETVDSPGGVSRHGLRVEHRLPIWSTRYGLHGYCDTVEITDTTITPVEHKSGRTVHPAATIHVCAQALCLEEMFKTSIPVAVVYTTGTRQRHTIELETDLRTETIDIIEMTHRILASSRLPNARNDHACRGCSLNAGCLPRLVADNQRVGGLASATWRL